MGNQMRYPLLATQIRTTLAQQIRTVARNLHSEIDRFRMIRLVLTRSVLTRWAQIPRIGIGRAQALVRRVIAFEIRSRLADRNLEIVQ